MESKSESSGEPQSESADTAPPQPPVEEQSPAPRRFWGIEVGDVLTFVILIGTSAWLWSHAGATLGSGAAFVGAAIGLAVACLVRTFC